MIDIERLLRIPFVDSEGGFDLSPDGKSLAFAWNRTGRWEIYELGLNAADSPRLVSVGAGGKFAPKYSPDGSRLAYAVDFDGGENFHIFVHERHTDRHQDLTPEIDFAIQPRFCWSPDGTQIAFLADKSGCFDVYIMPASGGEARLLFANGFPASNVTWSPDGCSLAVTCDANGQDLNIYVVPLDGDEPFCLAEKNAPINAQAPAWSPDSQKLAFHSDVRDGFHQIGIFDLRSRLITWLTDGEANCRAPAWSKDGSQLTYVRAHGATDKVVLHPLDGRSAQLPGRDRRALQTTLHARWR